MVCDICKKRKATFKVKKNTGGLFTEDNVCFDCYYKHCVALTSLLKPFSEEVPSIKCSVCSTSLASILDTLYVGCPNCYKELFPFIQPTIKNVQNATLHEGKRPLGKVSAACSEYERLKGELSRAIELENYEQAAIISERLEQLRGERYE